MATLVLPFPTFTPGTPAYANQIQDNYVAIRDHINGQNIGTGNIEATLVSRVGGPILFLNQQSQEQIALSILNSRSKSAFKIQQTALLSAGNSIIHIKDDASHTLGDAQVFLELLVGSTIPALLVKHGAVETFKLRRTQLDLFASAVQVTSTDFISSRPLTLNTQSAGLSLKLKGRSSDSESQIQFKDTTDATEQARLTSQPTKLIANVPIGSTYEFKINDVDKVVIDNDGIDGQYLTDTSIAKTKMVSLGQVVTSVPTFNYSLTSGSGSLVTPFQTVTGSSTVITTTGRPLLVMLDGQFYTSNNGNGYAGCGITIRLKRDGVTVRDYFFEKYDVNDAGTGGQFYAPLTTVYFDAQLAGTYTYTLEARGHNRSAGFSNPASVSIQISNMQIIAYEL